MACTAPVARGRRSIWSCGHSTVGQELAEYFETRAREEERLLSSHPEWSPKGLRDRLLARRNAP